MKESENRYRVGLADGIPIGLGYLAVSFGFGISALGRGMRALETVVISMTNLTSAGQVAGVTVIVSLGTLLEMFLTQLIINCRYSLMGITLTQHLDTTWTTGKRMLCSFGITDEIFAVSVLKPKNIGTRYFAGIMTAPYIGWTLGTLLGTVAGQILPDQFRTALEFAIYAMFIAILVPALKKDWGVGICVLTGAGLSCLVAYLPALSKITPGFSIILCATAAALLMSWIHPIEEKKNGEDGSPETIGTVSEKEDGENAR